MIKFNNLFIILACSSLVGCVASVATTQTDESPAIVMPALVLEEPVPEIEYGSFTEDQLYEAIVSELSAQRGQVGEAGESYFDLAMSTRDLTIIQRAIQFASVNADTNALLQLGLLWAQLEPTNSQPQLLLSIQFLESGAFEQAISHMSRVLDLGGNMDFAALSSRTGRLNPQDRSVLIENLRRLKDEFGNQTSIHLTLVQLLAQNGGFEEALIELELLKDDTDLTPNMVMLESQILRSLDNPQRATRVMRTGVARFETDKSLRLNYARLLIQNEEYEQAQEQFQILVEQDPQDWETLYSVALLNTQLENFDRAIAAYTKLIEVDQRADESQYNLGLIHQQQDNLEKSIEHFRQVRIGTNNFLAAQQQATRLSIQSGRLDEAHDWLSQLSRGQPRLEVLFATIESSLLIQEKHPGAAEQLLNTA
ncbi:MAG: tetratricopeptide repeat protein, partial [Gammaproteobacteria bacterium]